MLKTFNIIILIMLSGCSIQYSYSSYNMEDIFFDNGKFYLLVNKENLIGKSPRPILSHNTYIGMKSSEIFLATYQQNGYRIQSLENQLISSSKDEQHQFQITDKSAIKTYGTLSNNRKFIFDEQKILDGSGVVIKDLSSNSQFSEFVRLSQSNYKERYKQGGVADTNPRYGITSNGRFIVSHASAVFVEDDIFDFKTFRIFDTNTSLISSISIDTGNLNVSQFEIGEIEYTNNNEWECLISYYTEQKKVLAIWSSKDKTIHTIPFDIERVNIWDINNSNIYQGKLFPSKDNWGNQIFTIKKFDYSTGTTADIELKFSK